MESMESRGKPNEFEISNKKGKEGRVTNPEIAEEMAAVEAPYHEKRFGILKPSQEKLAAGNAAAEAAEKKISDDRWKEKIEAEERKEQVKLLELKSKFRESIDLIVNGNWVDAETLKLHSAETPTDPELLTLVKDSETEHESGMGGRVKSSEMETKQFLQFVPRQLEGELRELLGLDDETKKKIGVPTEHLSTKVNRRGRQSFNNVSSRLRYSMRS